MFLILESMLTYIIQTLSVRYLKKKYTYLNRLVVVCFDFKKVCWLTSPRRCLFLILKSMLTGYLERDHLMGLCWHTFKNYADRLFRKRSSHGPMLAYLMLHLQVGIRTQTRTEIAILSAILNALKRKRNFTALYISFSVTMIPQFLRCLILC